MQQRVLILGGYGNFGKRIASALVRGGIPVIIAGRSGEKAADLAHSLPSGLAESACFDVRLELKANLAALKPLLVINTCGPFQNSDYSVAEACIDAGIHYSDLADGRDFVGGITALDARAKAANVSIVSGASTVPALSSAVIEQFRSEFSRIERLTFGISPGQKAERGLATTQGIMSYVGKKLKPFPGMRANVYGWQDIYRQTYPELGKRWMANCDIPDLDILPERYGITSIRFSAGLELGFLHLGLWGLSWLVRWGVPLNLQKMARPLLRISNLFDVFGSADGGMHVVMEGKDAAGKSHRRSWFIIARDGSGPHIPTTPAIVLAKKLLRGESLGSGAQPCVGLVSLDELLGELSAYPIKTFTR
ncbi:MAG: saccharopine dehydrogenase NADP-binding domain-containing protein [Holosporales bacterium]